MAIVIPILVSLGCGIAAGIFLGGFWWVVFGLLVGYMEAAILCFEYENIWDLDDNSFALFLIFPPLIGAIAAGIIIGGFGWVMLGLLIGFVVGCILYGAYLGGGKLLAALLLIGMPAGAVLALLYVDRRWYIVLLGVAAGALASFVLSLPHVLWLKAWQRKEAIRVAEEQQRWKEEAEAKKKRQEEEAEAERKRKEAEKKRREEIERNRPIEEKLAILENKTQKTLKKIADKLQNAQQEYSLIVSEKGKKPESLYKPYRDYTGGVSKGRVRELEDIAKYYAARCSLSVYRANMESAIYTANRKKAVLFVERLKDIYDKLTAKQKDRKIQDAAKSLQIGKVNVYIPDTLSYANQLSSDFRKERFEAVGEFLSSYSDFRDKFKLPTDGTNAAVFLTAMGIDFIGSLIEHAREMKEELESAHDDLHRSIEKIEKGRLKADGFYERANEINRALEGTMSAYEKMFVEIYNSLYPPGDESKSKEAREANKKKGGVYFSDEESDAVIQLRTTGQFLLNLVDTKFEGENDE